ncbi:Essential MCU regulator, mitochondrial [Amphibalanus amphitrite]|uniref:Essential MCU regulator, mitochondrial n=1 Tax=Amphibalanus amphitrite TaxID=1232801 RepID=A0A6A4VNE6_AMPAM|nr:Essential MCU regulator, mitochondrial [Amphibalanus amphitrite]
MPQRRSRFMKFFLHYENMVSVLVAAFSTSQHLRSSGRSSGGVMSHLRGLVRSVSAAALLTPARPAAPLRTAVTLPTGGVRPEPYRSRLGVVGALFTVIPGLLLGASISKNFASFLEENDLFVPS